MGGGKKTIKKTHTRFIEKVAVGILRRILEDATDAEQGGSGQQHELGGGRIGHRHQHHKPQVGVLVAGEARVTFQGGKAIPGDGAGPERRGEDG